MDYMDFIRYTIVGFFSALIAYFDPVAGNIEAFTALLVLNFFVGLITGIRCNGENFSLRKVKECFVWFALILTVICACYLIGERNGNQEAAVTCVRTIIIVAIWAFGTNIFRNLCALSKGYDPAHKFFFACYVLLSLEIVKKIPLLGDIINKDVEQHQKEENDGKD